MKINRDIISTSVYTITLSENDAFKLEAELSTLADNHGMDEYSLLYRLFQGLPSGTVVEDDKATGSYH